MLPVIDGTTPLMVKANALPEIQSAVAFAAEQHAKIIIFGGYEEDGQLFNLAEDPFELKNLWSHPAAQSLKLALMQKLIHLLTVSDRFDTERHCGA